MVASPGSLPPVLEALEQATRERGSYHVVERTTGALLRTLAASKPGGRILELGTGTGVSTAWLLDGASQDARIDSVDGDAEAIEVARRFLGEDARVTFHVTDGMEFIEACDEEYDLIFADMVPGKYKGISATLSLLGEGGMYVVDHMSASDAAPEIDALAERVAEALEKSDALSVSRIDWSTGIVIATLRSA